MRGVRVFCILALFLALAPVAGSAMSLPEAGQTLKPFAIPTPPAAADKTYLGVGGESFTLADVKAKLIMLEFSGVYCPICHEQAPYVRKLYKRVEKAGLMDRMRIFSVAGGATQVEVDSARAQYNAPYPIIRDPDFAVHDALGEPKTPFTMLLRPDGTVLWTHLGRIEDFDAFFQTIQSFL